MTPEILSLYVSTTERCNLKCPGCSVGIDKRIKEGIGLQVETIEGNEDWTVDGLLRAFRSEVGLAKEKWKELRLKIKWAGGEPLLRWDLIEEVQSGLKHLVEEYGIEIEQVILTNGLLLDRRAEDIVRLVKETQEWSEWNVAVSLWDWGEENFIKRGRSDIKGGFNLIEQGLRKLHEGGVDFNLQHTFGPWGEADDLVEFAKHLWDVEAEGYLGRDEQGEFWYVDKDGKPMPFRLSLAFWRKQEGLLTREEALKMWIQAKRLLDWLEEKMIGEGKYIRSLSRIFTYIRLRSFSHGTCGTGDVYWAIEPSGGRGDYKKVRCHEGLYGRNPDMFTDERFAAFRDGGEDDPITWIFPENIAFRLAMQLGGRGCPNTWMRVFHDEETGRGYEDWKETVESYLKSRDQWNEAWEKEFQPPLPMTVVYASLMPRLLLLAYVNGDDVDELMRLVFYPDVPAQDFKSVSKIHKVVMRQMWRWQRSKGVMTPDKKWWAQLDREIGSLSSRERKVLGDLLGLRGDFFGEILFRNVNPTPFIQLLISGYRKELFKEDDWDGSKLELFESEADGLFDEIFKWRRLNSGIILRDMARDSGFDFQGIKSDPLIELMEIGDQFKRDGWWRFLRNRPLLTLTSILSLWEMWSVRGNWEMLTMPMVVVGSIGLLLLWSESNDNRTIISKIGYSLDRWAARRTTGTDQDIELFLESLGNMFLFRERSHNGDRSLLGGWLLFLALGFGGVRGEVAAAVGSLGILSFFLDRGLSILMGGRQRIEDLSGLYEMTSIGKTFEALLKREKAERDKFLEKYGDIF